MIPGTAEYDVDVQVPEEEITSLLSVDPASVARPAELTFARNVFLPVTTACRYTCTYCTFYDPPGQATLMSPGEIREAVRRGVKAGCTEALFTLGDEPDDRYTELEADLADLGHESIHSYLREASEIALEEGLLPHGNPGDQTRDQMAQLADVMASMGVMLETTADLDVHAGSRRKVPGQRLATIRNAGELKIPFTTGILFGIGETWRDRAESLLAIAALHERYGHIQEVIVQPVTPNERWDGDPPDVETMRRVVAMARKALPGEVAVQVPPNLAPVGKLLDAGVEDLGGVSPVTEDYVNPSFAWPAVSELESIAESAGLPLRERLPVYERYLPTDGLENEWIPESVGRVIYGDTEAGRRYRALLDREEGPRV
ncbi:MAG: 7,8-didemethyl-8-hydroxy-5-deazariboflavin synthase subunit CofG [Halodesulfurarchaeum sp.]